MVIDNLKLIVGGILIFLLFGTGFCSGYKVKKCPTITTNTMIVHDTIIKKIPNNIYHYSERIVRKDSIIYNNTIEYKDVDTAQILRNWTSIYIYDRYFHDSNINVYLTDSISQNKSIGHSFKYELLKPQIVTNNELITKNYRRSLYAGAGIDSKKDLSIQGLYTGPKLGVGIGYAPMTKNIEVKAYINLFNF